MARLTDRELEILRLVKRGLTNAEVGATLGIAGATVAWHLTNVLAKLEASSRTAAVATAMERGLLETASG